MNIGGTTTEALTSAAHDQARAEAASYRAMLEFHRAEWAAAESAVSPLICQVERSMIPLTIGQAMGLSEGQVVSRLGVAERVNTQTPQVWLAFLDGRIDAARVREISHTIEKLQRDESIIRLDQKVVAYAETHTVAELKAWLRRFVVRVEADLAVERAEAERANRYVDISHGDEGMSWLSAYLPSHMATAIAKRLDKHARTLGADDPRTLPQRKTDLFAAWLTTTDTREPALNADIAVTISADVLAGAVDGFATSADGQWVAPAGWIADIATTGNPFWHRMVLQPVTGDVLSHEYTGRFSPDTLTKALAFRDGVCQAPGCLTPADRCDMDHRQPWPEGSTSGANMWPLCRTHHIHKGHHVLQWIMPNGDRIDAQPAHQTAATGPISQIEHHLATVLVEYTA